MLGAVLLDNQAMLGAMDLLKPEDFFLNQHRHIFSKMLELHQATQAIDLVTLSEGLFQAGELEAAGGAPYLASLADGMPRVSNVGHYAGIVKQKATLRKLAQAAYRIQNQALDNESPETILGNAAEALAAISNEQTVTGPIPIKNIVRDNFERLEKIFTAGRAVTGLPTGYTELDRLTSGLQASELVILAARPSVGKTAMALNLVENICVRDKHPAVLFSLEMGKEALLVRLLAAVAQIDAHRFRTGHLSREDWQRITEALGTLAEAPLWIDDSSSPTVAQIGARTARLKPALVLVDYLQLITAMRRNAPKQEQVSDISRSLKAMAKDLAIPVIALSQLSRAPEKEDRSPLLSDLRDSGSIEQDADMVMFLHRPKMYESGATPEEREETHLVVAKQRNGPTDMVRFVFRSRFTRFEEAAPDYFQSGPDENLPYKDD